VYDDYTWYKRFSDTSFAYGRLLAQTVGLSVLRLADADLLPFKFQNFSTTVDRYVNEVEKLLKEKRDETIERNAQIAEGVFGAIADPKHKRIPPPVSDVPPYLNFAPLENALPILKKASERYDQAVAGGIHDRGTLPKINRLLMECQLSMTDADGLPGRPWFRNLIYAPGLYTGYGVKTLPGVREAIEQKHWAECETQIARLAAQLTKMASVINSAAKEIDASQP
jgi:N-acetylated-alpha-linked acidic dipeptidase